MTLKKAPPLLDLPEKAYARMKKYLAAYPRAITHYDAQRIQNIVKSMKDGDQRLLQVLIQHMDLKQIRNISLEQKVSRKWTVDIAKHVTTLAKKDWALAVATAHKGVNVPLIIFGAEGSGGAIRSLMMLEVHCVTEKDTEMVSSIAKDIAPKRGLPKV